MPWIRTVFKRPGRLFGAVVLCGAVLAGAVLTGQRPAGAEQRMRSVVALECAGPLRLCQALVQAMSEQAPAVAYRINPKPAPPGALTVRVALTSNNSAQLSWPGGTGEITARKGHNDAEFARHIVTNANPALARALNGS